MKKNSIAITALLTGFAVSSHAGLLNVNSVVLNNGQADAEVAVDFSTMEVSGNLTNSSLGSTYSDFVFLSNDGGTAAAVVTPSVTYGTRIGDVAAGVGTLNGGGVAYYTVTTNGTDLITEAGVKGADLSGSINLSGLQSGTIHLIYGTFNDAVEVTANMNDGVDDLLVTDLSGGSFANGVGMPGQSGHILTSYTFDTTDGFDTFTWQQINADTDGSRARFSGVMITDAVAVPEPGTLGLVAIFGGGVLFIRRRFRR